MLKIILMRPQSLIKKTMPLGIMFIAGYLRKYSPDVDVRIIDLRVKPLDDEALRVEINKFSPDVIGISSVSIEAENTHLLAEKVKGVNKDIKIIIGGPYASSLPSQVMNDENIFCCVIGEGERAMHEIVEALKNHNNELGDIHGIAFRKNGEYIEDTSQDYITDIDSIPVPAYNLIEFNKYFRRFGSHINLQARRDYSSIFTSRGCPFKCTYCHNMFGKSIRYKSVDSVLEEIKLLYNEYKVREIHIEDDSFNINRKRAKEIFRKIIKENLDIKFAFPNGVRADYIDEELLDLFKTGGVYHIAYGIESGSLRIQKKIMKKLDLELARNIIKLTSQKGITAQGFFMFGFLDETKEDMLQTIKYAVDSSLHMASFGFVVPHVGTPIFYEAKERKFNIETTDTKQLNPRDTDINISSVSSTELQKIKRHAYMKFYLNIGRMIRLFMVTRNKPYLFKSFLMFATNVSPVSPKLRESLQGILNR